MLTSSDKTILCSVKIIDITHDILDMLKELPDIPKGNLAAHWNKLNRKIISMGRMSTYITNINCTHDFKLLNCDSNFDTFECNKCKLFIYYECIDNYRKELRIG